MRVDLSRWPFLLGAALCVTAGVILLLETGAEENEQVAALILLVLGAVLLGAFIVHPRDKDRG